MHECPKTHFKHKCMHASHHATSSCHVTMPHNHAMSSCHISIPCHHTKLSCHLACHVIMPCQHATSSCNINMLCHHATSPCHVSMSHHHDTLSCHVIRMHFLTTTWQLEGVPRGTLAKIFPVGAKLQNAISFASGVCLACRLHRWNHLDELT